MNDLTIGAMVEHMVPSDRLIVEDSKGNELYNGYVANFHHGCVSPEAKVKRFGLHTDIFRKERYTENFNHGKTLGATVPVESACGYKFSDLAMMIFTRAKLEPEEQTATEDSQ